MNSTVYLFGVLGGGYTQYPDDYSREIFSEFEKNIKSPAQLMIHRSDAIIYYGYLRKLSEQGKYIGIAFVFNGAMCADYQSLCKLCEENFTNWVVSGDILEFTDNGDITSKIDKLYKTATEFKRISESLSTQIESSNLPFHKLPPVNYAISSNVVKKFNLNDGNETINEALKDYSNIYIYSDSTSVTLTGYSDKLRSLNQENIRLRDENVKVLREKKRTTIVTILSIVVAIGIIIIIGFANRSSEQGHKIELLERDKKSLNEHIRALAKDSVRFEKELSDTKDELNYQKRSAAQLKVDKDELEDELATANENIEAYKQTIDQQKKQLDEKEQAIANLRGQLRNQAYSSTPFQINITKIEVASLKKNKTLANKYGDCLLASDSYYIKVRMNYSCTSSGMKELTLDLYDVSAGTKKYSTEIERVDLYTTGTYEFNTYLGNKGKRLYAGIYRVVISYKGDVIKSEDFIIH